MFPHGNLQLPNDDFGNEALKTRLTDTGPAEAIAR